MAHLLHLFPMQNIVQMPIVPGNYGIVQITVLATRKLEPQ
jgi:hypothetical protein